MDENPTATSADQNPSDATGGTVDLLHGAKPWTVDDDTTTTDSPDSSDSSESPDTTPVATPVVATGPTTYGESPYASPYANETFPPITGPGYDGPYGGGPGLPTDGSGSSGKGRTWGRRVGALGVVAAVALASGATGAAIATRNNDGTSGLTTASPVNVGTGTNPTETLAKVAAAVQPSVVSITVQAGQGGDEGSGVIVRSDGTILTNNHVIEAAANGAGTITVKFESGKTASATIVGRDPGTDLAVIKADGVSGLTPATLASSSSLHVGDTVLALGSPLGLEGSVTSGIVSALHRTVGLGSSSSGNGGASLSDAIQTDAAINPGNSGGALADIQGRVVGINSAIATLGASTGGQSGSIGLGFAIPIDEAKSVADTLIAGGTVAHAVLGVSITDAPNGGALVDTVNPGSAAQAAGLQAGDVIVRVDGVDVADGSSLAAAVRTHKPGDKVVVTYTRGGQTRTATVTLGTSTA